MACVRCSREISEDAAFCQFCGANQQEPTVTERAEKRFLRRSRSTINWQVSAVGSRAISTRTRSLSEWRGSS